MYIWFYRVPVPLANATSSNDNMYRLGGIRIVRCFTAPEPICSHIRGRYRPVQRTGLLLTWRDCGAACRPYPHPQKYLLSLAKAVTALRSASNWQSRDK